MRSTFRVLFYVKKGSARPNGDLPLMCRLTVDGEVKQFSCKMDVPPRLWDVKNGRATGKSVEAMQINLAVDKIRVEVNRRYQELMQSDGYVTAAKLRDAYLGIGVKQETLLKLFEQHNVEYRKKVGFNREVATWKKYCCVCKRVRGYGDRRSRIVRLLVQRRPHALEEDRQPAQAAHGAAHRQGKPRRC